MAFTEFATTSTTDSTSGITLSMISPISSLLNSGIGKAEYHQSKFSDI